MKLRGNSAIGGAAGSFLSALGRKSTIKKLSKVHVRSLLP